MTKAENKNTYPEESQRTTRRARHQAGCALGRPAPAKIVGHTTAAPAAWSAGSSVHRSRQTTLTRRQQTSDCLQVPQKRINVPRLW
jgi:hypothetical protein